MTMDPIEIYYSDVGKILSEIKETVSHKSK